MVEKETDRELLELAAQAVGYVIEERFAKSVNGAWVYPKGATQDTDGDFPVFHWWPGSDDGDGARLEAALGISVEWHEDLVIAVTKYHAFGEAPSKHRGDKQAARRMAALRCAAAIGKAGE